ncbi:glycosyltransferase family 39 protein [Croceicoccus mobilis]|uniref:Glycosyltransferase RgtA/B/C/D-like domain-containing protein n=1 Tax=Croceicoccus mobilis TaxID=1703339 RepID=A0A917DU87_9SPHN|nr:glycosyltransferase family 39 protein [Croceicoccus mobilis]GGD67688.1 hypothetical protein GCM10010990_16490 [Croceicoccus mobilis]
MTSTTNWKPTATKLTPSLDKETGNLWACKIAMVLLLGMQFSLIFTRAINWDEFHFYGQVIQFSLGQLHSPLQTIHVHAFAWLTSIPGNYIDRIIVARIPMFACEIVTIACITMLARRFTHLTNALICALCYLSMGFVLQHGMSFRVDPLVTSCLMAALVILARARWSWWVIAALAALIGLAGMITIKAVLFTPAFLGVGWMRWNDDGRDRTMTVQMILAGLGAVAVFALLYLWHNHSLTTGSFHVDESATNNTAVARSAAGNPADTSHEARKIMTRSTHDMFFLGVPPYLAMIVKAASLAPLLTGLIIIAPFVIARSRLASAARLALVGLWLPVLTLAFYRNTAGYYYAFMLAPVCVACVPAIAWLSRRFGSWLIILVLLVTAFPVWLKDDREVLGNQRAVVTGVERMFPSPVSYFDHSGMISTFPKANGFMTPWGLERYRAEGVETYRRAMNAGPVPLLIDNDYMIHAVLENPEEKILLSRDAAALRDNYVRFWGPVLLAGKTIAPKTVGAHEFLVPGEYRVEGAALTLDDKTLKVGEIVQISRGAHELANQGSATARLIWNEIADEPDGIAPDGRLWIGY